MKVADTTAGTTIIYLPPFCQPCKHVLLTKSTATAAATTRKQAKTYTTIRTSRSIIPDTATSNNNDKKNSSDSGNVATKLKMTTMASGSKCDYGSCCQRRKEHKNYYKQATSTSTSTLTSTSTTAARIPFTTSMTTRRSAAILSQTSEVALRDNIQERQRIILRIVGSHEKNNSSSGKECRLRSCNYKHRHFLQKHENEEQTEFQFILTKQRIILDTNSIQSNFCNQASGLRHQQWHQPQQQQQKQKRTLTSIRYSDNEQVQVEKDQVGEKMHTKDKVRSEKGEYDVSGCNDVIDVSNLCNCITLTNAILVMPNEVGVVLEIVASSMTVMKNPSTESRLEKVNLMLYELSSVDEVKELKTLVVELKKVNVATHQSYASLRLNSRTTIAESALEQTDTIITTNTNKNTTNAITEATASTKSHTTRLSDDAFDADADYNVCRCLRYNSDISTLGKVGKNSTECYCKNLTTNATTQDVQDYLVLMVFAGTFKEAHAQDNTQKCKLPMHISSTSSSNTRSSSCSSSNEEGKASFTLLKCWQHLMYKSKDIIAATTDAATSVLTNKNRSAYATSVGKLSATSKYATTTATQSWFLLLLMLMLTTTANCWGGRQDVPTNCTFPARWEGSWFLSGYQQSIHIKGSQFSYRGRCAASDGNKYLIVDEKGCHRCLVIYEKHKNVLQYKESECEGDSMYMHQSNPSALAMRSSLKQSGDHRGGAHPNTNGHSRLSSSDQYIMRSNDDMNDYFCKGRETLQNLCDQIPGDALLYSLFRESAEPVKCPLKGPFIFTYNRGHGECKSPVSNIESCTEDSRLLLSFQACPDVQGTESTVEELTCLATWKDGNSRYLVGLVSHHHAISNEERYRCFVYEKISSLMGGPSILSSKDAEYKLAQSGDATCNGLDSAEVGSRIMSLRKPPLAERCDFPVWFKGPRHWHALMGNAVYNYHSNDGSVHIIKPNGYMETRALCEQINKQTATEMMAVVHYTTGCQSGFMCMMFYRRDTHVIEIQTGKPAIRLEDACAPEYFDINKMAYITLLASNPDPQICPMEGLYNLRGAIGPPYLATRHKRNHNNKIHFGHGHHHLHEGDLAGGGSFGHKRTLSFRNSEHVERASWHANTRGFPARSRRDANKSSYSDQSNIEKNSKELILNGTNDTNVGFVSRSRRDVPGCVTNYKAQRQLWVGCTEANVINVRPLCNEDGEEEYSCHGSWSENDTVYIIARHKSTKHGVCISFRPTEGSAAKLVIGDACYRGIEKPPDHHLIANLSVFGKCGETGSTSMRISISNWLIISAVALNAAAMMLGNLDKKACAIR